MPDDAPETGAEYHPIRNQPVVVGNLVNAVVILAGFAGVTLVDNDVAAALTAIGTLIVFGQTVYAQWRRVTPEARAQEREARMYADGVAVGVAAVPRATVVRVGTPDTTPLGLKELFGDDLDVADVDVEPVATPAPPPGRAGQVNTPEKLLAPPPAGLIGGVSGFDRAP